MKTGIKWAWLLLVIGFASFYVYSRHDLAIKSLLMLNWKTLLASLAAIAAAKLALVENMRLSALRADFKLSFTDCYYIYNNTHLAKYLPGSVWHFVSRITILRERGAPASVIRDSMMAENLWILSTALLFGFVFILVSEPALSIGRVKSVLYEANWKWYILAITGTAGLAIMLHPTGRRLLRWGWDIRPYPIATIVLLAAWMLLGSAFWIALQPFTTKQLSWLFTIGIYCVAFLIGFIAPFAPAGLGIREVVLAVGVSGYVGPDEALMLAGINRILYISVEATLFMTCLPIFIRNRKTRL